jgi:hypothetical protein
MPTPLPQIIQQQTVSYQNFRVGDGDPNTIGQYGQLGWTYQDWANGDLYVYGEPAIGGPTWLQVLRDEANTPGSTDGQIFTNDGGYNVWSYGINNSSGQVMGWSEFDGLRVYSLLDFNTSADFDNRQLLGVYGEPTASWGEGLVITDSNGNPAINCQPALRMLSDRYGINSVDFDGRGLFDDSGYTTLNYGTKLLNVGDYSNCYWGAGDGIRLLGGKTDGDYSAASPKLAFYNDYLNNTTPAPIVGFNTQYFTPLTGTAIFPANTPGNDILIVLDPAGTLASLTIVLSTMLDNLLGGGATEARIQIFSTRAITTLTINSPGYPLVGAAITTIAANGQHTLRLSSKGGAAKKLYHVI